MRRQSASRPVNRSGLNDAIGAFLAALDKYTNLIFALNHDVASIRSLVTSILILLIWLVLSFTALPSAEYPKLVNAWAATLPNLSTNPQVVLFSTLKFLATIFLNPVVIRHMLALYAPYWLMQRVASIYLADIFEKDEKVASTFIDQAAFGGYYNTIHISAGKVAEKDLNSPIIQIGGPGYVVVELDSAVVFERPDGSPHVIGSTSKEFHGSAMIQGFERIRQGVDLRDVIQKQEVTTRSRDGIPVTAKDVQYSYSIYRGPKPVKTAQTPYPYDENAVLNLVYNTIKPVKLDEAPLRDHDWSKPLPGQIYGMIGGEMGSFINKRGLSDFLAAVGKLEDDNFLERKKETEERLRAISGQPESRSEPPVVVEPAPQPDSQEPSEPASPGMDFVPRSMLTNMFYENFQSRAAQRGIYLNWIGVGTWDTPTQIIPRNHREAWMISRDNFTRGNPAELQRLFEEARLQELIRLIEDVSIRKVYNEHEKQQSDDEVIISVLKEYLGVLERARELYRPNIQGDILTAIRQIEHWLYPPSHQLHPED